MPTEPVYDDQRYSSKCFASCPGYPTVTSDSNLCQFFLSTVYYQCSTFDIGMGLCSRIDCSNDCNIATYCYYAAATVIKCPVANNSADRKQQREWTAASSVDVEGDLIKQCSLHYGPMSNTTDSDFNDQSGSGAMSNDSQGLRNFLLIGG